MKKEEWGSWAQTSIDQGSKLDRGLSKRERLTDFGPAGG
jgi:hypothetical protein